jgi:hypothetical protein
VCYPPKTADATEPSDFLRSIDSHDLAGIWPVFGATDEASAHRILKHVIPLGGVALVAPQQTIMKPRLPEGRELLARPLYRFASRWKQNAVKFAFQSLDPRTQGRHASNSEADEQVNVIGHKNVSPDTDTKISSAAAVFDENFVYFRGLRADLRECGIKRYE